MSPSTNAPESTTTAQPYVIGVDVGTTSARAGVVRTRDGHVVSVATHAIDVYNPAPNFYEHSSDNIWHAVCTAVREAVQKAAIEVQHEQGTPPFGTSQIGGIAFDATCSLVVLGADDAPISVSPTNDPKHNVIVWMDHRASQEAREINATQHPVLRYVGGSISIEMEVPKLLWLHRHKPDTFVAASKFFDLADFLSYRATGVDAHEHHRRAGGGDGERDARDGAASDFEHGWSKSFFQQIGLPEFVNESFKRIGEGFFCRNIGERIGNGLTETAAQSLGLAPGTAVGIGIIDAHAGGLGVVGAALPGIDVAESSPSPSSTLLSTSHLAGRMGLICGTSSCHMLVSDRAAFVPGIWGPFHSAMVPGTWLLEGGQSATGALLDHLLDSHALGASLREEAATSHRNVFDLLNDELQSLARAASLAHVDLLTQGMHVFPDFHGNRSPRADPSLTGMLTGLTLRRDRASLALLYLCGVQSLAYGTRHIVDTMRTNGAPVEHIFACGGLSKNRVFMQAHADATGCVVWLPRERDAMILGTAIIAATASGAHTSIVDAMAHMSAVGERIDAAPRDSLVARYHERRYRVFLEMHEDQKKYAQMEREEE